MNCNEIVQYEADRGNCSIVNPENLFNLGIPFYPVSLVDLVNLSEGAGYPFSDASSPLFARLGPGACYLLRTTHQSF